MQESATTESSELPSCRERGHALHGHTPERRTLEDPATRYCAIVLDLLTQDPRTLASSVEIRPSKPPKKPSPRSSRSGRPCALRRPPVRPHPSPMTLGCAWRACAAVSSLFCILSSPASSAGAEACPDCARCGRIRRRSRCSAMRRAHGRTPLPRAVLAARTASRAWAEAREILAELTRSRGYARAPTCMSFVWIGLETRRRPSIGWKSVRLTIPIWAHQGRPIVDGFDRTRDSSTVPVRGTDHDRSSV